MDLLCKQRVLVGVPDDVIFQICSWLSVADILALRFVNKQMHYLTKESNVWLLLLRRLTLALPSCQAVLPSSYVDGTLHTVEYYVCRALRLEQNWRIHLNPPAKHYRFNAHSRVLTMRFLPGGNHMVTVSQTSSTSDNDIAVWDMTFRGRRNHVAIATLHAQTAVQKLQVRYAVVRGHISLVIGFARPPVDGATIVTTVFVHVGILNEISTLGPGTRACHDFMAKVQDPFEKLSEPKTQYPVGAISLSDIDGHPILAVVHRPRRIAFYDLKKLESRSTLKLGPVPGYDTWRHSIWDIKILATQGQILVIRVLIGDITTTETFPMAFELYDIPQNGEDIENPMARERRIISNYGIDGFYVSDGDASWNFKIDPDVHLPMLHNLANCPPPPISIFVSTKAPRGFVHFLMRPEMTRGSDVAYSYSLPIGTHSRYIWDEQEAAVIIPGAYRSIVWMRSIHRQPTQGISVLQMAVYCTEGYEFSKASDMGHATSNSGQVELNEAMDEDGPINIRSPTQRGLKYPVILPELARAMRNGTWSIQFDEWLGRMFVATVSDDCIDVLDWSL